MWLIRLTFVFPLAASLQAHSKQFAHFLLNVWTPLFVWKLTSLGVFFPLVRFVELHPGTAVQAGRSRVRFPNVFCNFSFTFSFRPLYGTGVETNSNRNEYQEYFLGGKVAGA